MDNSTKHAGLFELLTLGAISFTTYYLLRYLATPVYDTPQMQCTGEELLAMEVVVLRYQ